MTDRSVAPQCPGASSPDLVYIHHDDSPLQECCGIAKSPYTVLIYIHSNYLWHYTVLPCCHSFYTVFVSNWNTATINMKRLRVSVWLPAVAGHNLLMALQQNHLSWTHSAAARAPYQPLHSATAADGCCAFVYIQHICRSGTPRLLVAMGTGYQTWLQSLGEIDLWPCSCSHTSRPPPPLSG